MNYWETLPIRVTGRFYVPVTLDGWISPRGYASLGDDPLACWGLCSRAMMHSIAVYPAVPMAIASRVLNFAGTGISHSAGTRAFWAYPP